MIIINIVDIIRRKMDYEKALYYAAGKEAAGIPTSNKYDSFVKGFRQRGNYILAYDGEVDKRASIFQSQDDVINESVKYLNVSHASFKQKFNAVFGSATNTKWDVGQSSFKKNIKGREEKISIFKRDQRTKGPIKSPWGSL